MRDEFRILLQIADGNPPPFEDLMTSDVHWLVREEYLRYVGTEVQLTALGQRKAEMLRARAARKAIAPTAD